MRDTLTTKEAAEKLGISRRRINDLINGGRLPAEKIGRDYLIKVEDLKLVEDRKPGRPPKPRQETAAKGSKKRGGKIKRAKVAEYLGSSRSKAQMNKTIKPYLDWLDGTFGHLAKEATRNNVSASAVAHDFLSDPARQESFRSQHLPEVCERVIRFWKENHKTVASELKVAPGLKARFGGDIGPQPHNKPFERVGLYFDTMVVPDPLFRVATLPYEGNKNKDFYFLRYAISQLQFKEVYLADVVPSVATLVAEPSLFESKAADDEVYETAAIDSVAFANELYDQKLESFDEARKFFSKFKTIQEAAKEIARPELFFLDEKAPLDPLSQLEASLMVTEKDWDISKLPHERQGPLGVLHIIFSRMAQANDTLNSAHKLGGHPLMQAEVSFHWLYHKIKINQKLIGEHLKVNTNLELVKTNALFSKKLDWLGNVPLSALIELRKKGRLAELRKLIDQDLNAISNVSLINVERVASEIDYSLSTALERHHEKVVELNRDLRTELASSTPTLLIAIAAALQPVFAAFLPAWIAAVGGIVGTTKVKDVVTATSKYLKERKALKKSPVGILWEAKEASKQS
jgi:excisionase family DNA binding protein